MESKEIRVVLDKSLGDYILDFVFFLLRVIVIVWVFVCVYLYFYNEIVSFFSEFNSNVVSQSSLNSTINSFYWF